MVIRSGRRALGISKEVGWWRVQSSCSWTCRESAVGVTRPLWVRFGLYHHRTGTSVPEGKDAMRLKDAALHRFVSRLHPNHPEGQHKARTPHFLARNQHPNSKPATSKSATCPPCELGYAA